MAAGHILYSGNVRRFKTRKTNVLLVYFLLVSKLLGNFRNTRNVQEALNNLKFLNLKFRKVIVFLRAL